MRPSRALLAAALQITVTAAFTMALVLFLAPIRDQSMRGALSGSAEIVGPRPRMVVGVIAAFFAGWWGASGLTRRWIEQGFLIGALVAVFGALLALVDGEIGARVDALLLALVAAVAGSAIARLQPRIRRAFVAAATQVVALLSLGPLIMISTAIWLMFSGGTPSDIDVAAIVEWTPTAGLAVGLLTTFAAGWWAARGLQTEAVNQGLITGAMITALSLVAIGILGGEIGPTRIPVMVMDLAAATSGAAFAGARHRAG